MTARGRRTTGAHTKVTRRGQKYDADLRGSDVVIVARAANGLCICPGYIANKIFQLRGTPSDTQVSGVPLATFKVGTAAAGGKQEEAALERLS
jgi:hypothetical protein